MSNSSLVTFTKISPNKTSPRNHVIDTITIHCMAGNLSVEQCGALFAKSDRKASSNYGVDSKGNIGLYVDEKDRSWATSNGTNDNRAITIEVANDGGADTGWHVSNTAYKALIKLLVDICKRNNIKELKWKADISLIGHPEKQNMTVHRWFAAKSCPGDYLYSLHGQIAAEVNSELKKNSSNFQNDNRTIDTPKFIWNKFKKAGFSDVISAAIMGNLYDESHFKSNNLQNSFEKKLKMNDEEYTAAVNSKTYTEQMFIKDGAGYGLAQWTYWSRKQALYDYTVKLGYSIDDLDRQVSLIIMELTGQYKGILRSLSNTTNIQEASNLILFQYERPADQGKSVQNRRAEYAKVYYDKFSSSNGISSFIVKVSRDDLNIRSGPGMNYDIIGQTGKGNFTIVDVSNNWGLLKTYSPNRNGWISLDYVERY